MAPEVALHQPYTEKVDVYSFGIVIWTVARNKPPYADFNSETHHQRVVLDGVRPKLEKSWPADFCNLLELCWHKDFTKRPSFEFICTQLDHMIEELKSQHATPASTQRPSPMGLLRVFSPSSNSSKK
jgi:serine/threonine protein kinase